VRVRLNAPGTTNASRSSVSFARNEEIAGVLEKIGGLLDIQGANPHRIRAYRRAARILRASPTNFADLPRSTLRAELEEMPGIGRAISAVVRELVETRRSRLLDRLQGRHSPIDTFMSIPGIGETLAERVAHGLGIETLEELEIAAHDGRLARLKGVGARRAEGIRDVLATVLRRSPPRPHDQGEDRPHGSPSVGALLSVDTEYRKKAQADALPRIAPHRFNSDRRAWLPILHTEREGWSITALFSNTARAHELGMTWNWVVLYFEKDGDEGQCTVVSETHGPLRGRRVVRGREHECLELFFPKLYEDTSLGGGVVTRS
jgi:DNA polymerase (family X)